MDGMTDEDLVKMEAEKNEAETNKRSRAENQKNKKSGVDSPSKRWNEEREAYLDLFDMALFDEAFMLLERNVVGKDIIEKNMAIRKFIGEIMNEDEFSKIFAANNVLQMSKAFMRNVMENDSFKWVREKLPSFADQDMLNSMYSTLVQNGEYEMAGFLGEVIKPKMPVFSRTLANVIGSKNSTALKFMCENMGEIHYDDGELLRACYAIPKETLRNLIDKHGFDINEQKGGKGDNLLSTLVKNGAVKNFKFLMENYGDSMNFNFMTTDSKGNRSSFFDLLKGSDVKQFFMEAMLDDLTLKKGVVLELAKLAIYEDARKEHLDALINSETFERLFSHPNFNQYDFGFGEYFFIYGLLSKIGDLVGDGKSYSAELAERYAKIMEIYLANSTSEEVIPSTEYNVVGGAVLMATMNSSEITERVAAMVAERYPNYINQKNPNGKYTIQLVQEGSFLHKMLLNSGAVPLSEPKGWLGRRWDSWGWSKKQPELDASYGVVAKADESLAAKDKRNLSDLRGKIRDNMREMESVMDSPLCDPKIKFKSENMFLKADRLLKTMEGNKALDCYEELSFLGQNFANYLKKSLSYYMEACEATRLLNDDEEKAKKLEAIESQCLEQIDLLNEQLELISKNAFANEEYRTITQMRVQRRFLTEKFNDIPEAMRIEEVIGGANEAEMGFEKRFENLESDLNEIKGAEGQRMRRSKI